MKRFDGTEINEADAKRFRELVDTHRWIFAKTYAAFCPHEYTLRRQWDSDEDYRWFAEFIYRNGFDARYGNTAPKRYFVDDCGGWYYFLFPEDIDEFGKSARCNTLINRGSLSEFELVEETDMFGTEYRWKRLPKEKRRNPYESLPER